jgi:hypothetical protein
MLTINVNPANQGFPRAPDGGVIVPTPIEVAPTNQQAFAPAPLVNLFPIEPLAPLAPVLPALVGPPMIPVAFAVVPPALEVDVGAETLVPVNVPNFVVTDQGSYQSTAQEAVVSFMIASVVDNDTGGAASSTSVNLLITLVPNNTPLTLFGVSMAGRNVGFITGAWIPGNTTPERPILVYSDFTMVVPNQDSSGVPLFHPTGPVPGNVIAVDTARYDGELVTQNTGTGEQNVVPTTQTLPLGFVAPAGSLPIYLPALGDPSSGLPVPEFVVNDQMLTIGTPADYSPGISEQARSASSQDVIVGAQTGVLGQPITVYPGAQNR